MIEKWHPQRTTVNRYSTIQVKTGRTDPINVEPNIIHVEFDLVYFCARESFKVICMF